MLAIMTFMSKTCLVEIQPEYASFKSEIHRVFNIEEQYHNDILIYFFDESKAKVKIDSKANFDVFRSHFKANKGNEVFIELVKGSNLQEMLHSNKEEDKELNVKVSLTDAENDGLQFSFEELVVKNDDVHKEEEGEHNDKLLIELEEGKGNDDNKLNRFDSFDKQTETVFLLICCACSINPIKQFVFFCDKCDLYLCPNCYLKYKTTHRHPLVKLTDPHEIAFQEDANKMREEEGVKEETAYYSFYNPLRYMPNSVINILQIDSKEPSLRISQARKRYDLGNVSDAALSKAINDAKGDIDEAVILLASSSKYT